MSSPEQFPRQPECCYLHKALFEFEQGIRAYIATKVSNQEDAADLAQEVFLKISLAHARNETISKVKNWVFTLTRNTIAEYYRKKYRNREDLDAGQLMEPINETQELSGLAAADISLPLICLLDEKYRVPLILSDIREIPQKEIATRLDMTLPAVKSRIQRARVKLRELFFECTHIEYDKYGNVFSFEVKESCAPLRETRKTAHN